MYGIIYTERGKGSTSKKGVALMSKMNIFVNCLTNDAKTELFNFIIAGTMSEAGTVADDMNVIISDVKSYCRNKLNADFTDEEIYDFLMS